MSVSDPKFTPSSVKEGLMCNTPEGGSPREFVQPQQTNLSGLLYIGHLHKWSSEKKSPPPHGVQKSQKARV